MTTRQARHPISEAFAEFLETLPYFAACPGFRIESDLEEQRHWARDPEGRVMPGVPGESVRVVRFLIVVDKFRIPVRDNPDRGLPIPEFNILLPDIPNEERMEYVREKWKKWLAHAGVEKCKDVLIEA